MSGKALITGGSGFIGSNLANRLLSEGWEVVLFDNLSRHGISNNIDWLKGQHENVNLVVGDIQDIDSLEQVCVGVDRVYHTASQVAVTTSVKDPLNDFKINALGTLNLLEAIRKSESDPVLVFTSTNKVYGAMKQFKFEELEDRYVYSDHEHGNPESTGLDFHSPYGCSKGAGDQYVRDYARIYGLKNIVFRMSCIYGERQFGTTDQGWVCYFIKSHLLGDKVTIFGDGKQVRDILFIDDLVDAFQKASEAISKTKGEVYNIGGGSDNVLSILELLRILEDISGSRMEASFDEWRPGDQKVYYSDIRKAANDFGWVPGVSKTEGIRRLYSWIQANIDFFKS